MGDEWIIEDLSSSNGVVVNGARLVRSRALVQGDVVGIGPYRLLFHENRLISASSARSGLAVTAQNLSKSVPGAAGELKLLADLSLAIRPGEFVGLLGPSGCGKSTLMDLLCGRSTPTQGFVYYNGDELTRAFSTYRFGIGYVPQELIFHDTLTVRDVLWYTSKLRLPSDSSRAELEGNIDRVLGTVGLAHRKDARIRNLSGGQKKRVSLAIELVGKPLILFLDEVTSGLDVASEKEMMKLFRSLASQGVTVICITHFVDSLEGCDRLACLMRGRLVFYGPPTELKRHFQVEAISDVYSLEGVRSPEEWEQLFHRTRYYQPVHLPPVASVPVQRRRLGLLGGVRQSVILTRRYVNLLCADRTMPLLLIAMAPLIAGLLCLLVADTPALDTSLFPSQENIKRYVTSQYLLGFGSVLTLIFLSLFGSVQEVVKEARVLHHERSVSVGAVPYLISKVIPLFLIGALQTALVMAVLMLFSRWEAGPIWVRAALLLGSAWSGTAMGLAISANINARDSSGRGFNETAAATRAVMFMNAAVIPQILFSGAFLVLTGVCAWLAKGFVSAFWAFQGFNTYIQPILPRSARESTYAVETCLAMLGVHVVMFLVLFALGLKRSGR